MNKLRDNQKNAIIKFEEYYYEQTNNRGILSMCCGSGKTRTFYEIIKLCMNTYNEDFFIYTTSRILLVQGIVQELIEWLFFDHLFCLFLLYLLKQSLLNQDLQQCF